MLAIDWRRADQRDVAFYSPYWISSALITAPEASAIVPTITGTDIAAVSGSPDSLTQTAAGFVTAGFLDDDVIFVSGFSGAGATANLDFFTLAATATPGVAAATLTILAAETSLLSDAATESVTIVGPKANILFSFPKAGQIIIVKEIVVEILTGLTASSKIIVGGCTIPLETSTTGDLATITDKDSYLVSGTITTPQTAGIYGPTTSPASAFYTANAAVTWASPRIITGAATAVPCISVWVANASAITAGIFRVHALITRLPGV